MKIAQPQRRCVARRSLGEWLRVKGPKRSALLIGVDPGEQEMFLIMLLCLTRFLECVKSIREALQIRVKESVCR